MRQKRGFTLSSWAHFSDAAAAVLMEQVPHAHKQGVVVCLPKHFGCWNSPSAIVTGYSGPPIQFPHQNKAVNIIVLPQWHVMKVN